MLLDGSLQIFKKNGGGLRTLSFVWDGSENKMFYNENNDLNPLDAYYFSFMVHLCLLGSWYTSVGFTFSVFSLLTFMAQWTFVFSGSEMGALVWGLGYGRRWWRHYYHVNGVVLVSLFFSLEMFRATFCCFRFWLWACRRLRGITYCKYIFLHFLY